MIRPLLFVAGSLWLAAALHWLVTRSDSIAGPMAGYVVDRSLLGGLALVTTALAVLLLYWGHLQRVLHGLSEPMR